MEIKLREDKLNRLNIKWTSADTVMKVLDVDKREADTLRIKHVFEQSNLSKNFELDDYLNLLYRGKVAINFDFMGLKKLTNSQLMDEFNNYAIIISITKLSTNQGEF